jgi:hypothetical protein
MNSLSLHLVQKTRSGHNHAAEILEAAILGEIPEAKRPSVCA